MHADGASKLGLWWRDGTRLLRSAQKSLWRRPSRTTARSSTAASPRDIPDAVRELERATLAGAVRYAHGVTGGPLNQTGGSCTLTTAERPPCTTASASFSIPGSSPGSDTVTPYAPPAARATPGRSASGSKLT